MTLPPQPFLAGPLGAARARLSASVLGFRDFRLLWTGQTISTVGDQIFPVAVAIKLLNSGGGASQLGLVLAARWLALVLFVLVGGVYADRLPRKLVMMGSDAFRGVTVLGLALTPGRVPLWLLAGLVFLVGGGEAFFRPAYGAILPSVLPQERLGAGNALTSVSVRSAAVIGPAVGAVVVTTVGPRPAFVVDAATFAISFVTLLWLREPAFTPGPRQSMVRDVREGLVAVWRRRWVAAVLALAAFQLMFVLAPESVLLPIIGRREFHTDAVFGTALAVFSVGGVLGAVTAIRWRPRRPGLVGMLGILPLTLLPVALATPFSRWWIFGAYFVAGLGLEPFIVFWQVALQREFPSDLLARVTSVDWLCSFALMPLGLALTGPAVNVVGEAGVLWFGASVAFLPTLLVLRVPGLPQFRTPGSTGQPR